MDWLNYHHLYYFWTVVRLGSISQASQQLRISSPAISTQIRSLEESLGGNLLSRRGRNLVPTESGRVVFQYADDIFALGREMVETVKGRPAGRPVRLNIGIVDVLPKMIAQWLIEPALQLHDPIRIECREGSADQLVSQLTMQELDVVLSDVPVSPSIKVGAYSHLLGECGTTFVASAHLAKTLKSEFPESLGNIPMLLPAENTGIRKNLNFWFASQGIRPRIIGEFQDYAMLRAFGQAGRGAFPIPSVFERELNRQDSLACIGRTEEVRNRFYAISIERKLKHPAVVAICNTARRQL